MNCWVKIVAFIPLWFIFSGLFSGVVFLIYPDSYTGSRAEFEMLMKTNFVFLFLSQLAVFMGTFSTIFFISKFMDRKKPAYLKSMMNLNGILTGSLIGILGIILIIVLLSFSNKVKITYQGIGIEFVWYVFLFLLVAVTEEAMTRGFILNNFFNEINKYLAIVLSSIIFCLMHVLNFGFTYIGMMNLFIVGLFLCQLYLLKMNLSIPIGFHLTWNLFQGPVFGFPVSGLAIKGIFNVENISGEKFSFENFGLEGSLITTAIITLLIFYLYLTHTHKKLKKQRSSLKEVYVVS